MNYALKTIPNGNYILKYLWSYEHS